MNITQEQWEELYRTDKTPWRNKNASLLDGINQSGISSGIALDLGCGTGELAIALSSCGFEVEALDYSAEAIRQAKAQESSVHFVQWDLESMANYPFRHNAYDLVIMKRVLVFVSDKDGLLKTIAKHLKGVFVLEVLWEHDEIPEVVTPKEELELLLKNYFTIDACMQLPTRPGVVLVNYYLRKQ